MKRRCFKYIFLFNALVVLTVVIVGGILGDNQKTFDSRVPASVTTNLLVEGACGDISTSAESAVLIDAKSSAVLYEKNSDARLPMASTTKIMTAVAVIENANLYDVITVTPKSAGIEGSSVYLKAGEKLTVNDLLYALILESGNDAASALAIGVFGTEENCCAKMNEIAKSIGLIHTNFENVHGLDSDNHYTTAYELALIMKYALQNKELCKIMSSKNYTTVGENPRYFTNHNRLLKKHSFITGGKTGYTSKSGRCLVTSSRFGDKEYIAVTLSDKNDWIDHENMHMYANENFFSVEIADKQSFCLYNNGLKYIPVESVYLTIDRDINFPLTYKITFTDKRGRVEYFDGEIPLGNFSLILK